MRVRYFLFLLFLQFLPSLALAQEQIGVDIQQARGVDATLNYRSLTAFGPWDDRNYKLSLKDLNVLSPKEAEVHIPIPAFFRVELRREFPKLRTEGESQYPRAAVPLFRARYGGLLQNGRLQFVAEEGEIGEEEFEREEEEARAAVPVGANIKLNQLLTRDEVTVEINPVYPLRVIAGANSPNGQEMYFSSDGGLNWTIAGVLPNTCCDPTVGWSSDGLTAYTASLGAQPGLSLNFYKSTNFGQTWGAALLLRNSGTDKEFLHVDTSSTSPFIDNIYVTWHENNILQFARSTNGGSSFSLQNFPSAPAGIGSDITTDRAGNIYYCYAATNARQIILLKSTDGGASFGTPVVIAGTNASFDYPIPAMETRRAWTYAACDADRSGGPYDGSIYTSWTDTNAAESGTAANNHTQVKVAYSRNGGTTWTTVVPHPTDDVLTVDRFNQWLTVDELGNIHIVFYDTRNSVNRSGTDLYYTFSGDGGQTWNELTRISSQTSANLGDGQEWGDYNGISVVGKKIIPVWTDNRGTSSSNKNVYGADVENVAAEVGFSFTSPSPAQSVCRSSSVQYSISILSAGGFSSPVSMSLSGLPAGVTAVFSANPALPGTSITLTLSASAAAVSGSYPLTLVGTASGVESREYPLILNVAAGVPASPLLQLPPSGVQAGNPVVTLTWQTVSGATQYRVQLSTSPTFASTVLNTTTATNSINVSGLTLGQSYSWRVASIGTCGQGGFSQVRSFLSDARTFISADVPKAIPDNNPSGIGSTINVPESFSVTDVNLKCSITHPYDGDLTAYLIAPDGGSVLLFNNTGGSGDNFTHTQFDDAAQTPIASGVAPFTGIYRPAEDLGRLNGKSSQGVWTLKVVDSASQDTGTLTAWSLTLAGAPAGVGLSLTAPNGGEQWEQGTVRNITWQSTGLDAVKLRLYKGGVFHSYIGGTLGAGSGSYAWRIPAALQPGNDYQVMIYTPDYAYLDVGDGRFTISAAPLRLTAPNGGEHWQRGSLHNITWQALPAASSQVRLKLYKAGVFHSHLSPALQTSAGTYSWRLPDTLPPADDYQILLHTTDYQSYDVSDDYFSISAAPLHLLAPNGGEQWARGSTQQIRWESGPAAGAQVKLRLYKGGVFITFLSAALNTATGSFDWQIPASLAPGEDYQIVVHTTDYLYADASDRYFSITAPPLRLTSPNGGEQWVRGGTYEIQWSWTEASGSQVRLKLYKGGVLLGFVATPVDNTGSFSWSIPADTAPGSDYQILILSTNAQYFDVSDAYFTIKTP